jgi:hypothetical protein
LTSYTFFFLLKEAWDFAKGSLQWTTHAMRLRINRGISHHYGNNAGIVPIQAGPASEVSQ